VAFRHFTVDEANATLAEVRPLAERLVEHRRALRDAQAGLQHVAGKVAGNGGGLDAAEVKRAQALIERELKGVIACVERIHELGVQVKDADEGLLDFPALRGGEEVLLCWKLGEDEIGFWHTPEDGFAGRRPVPLD
jgi:hypothetical protein